MTLFCDDEHQCNIYMSCFNVLYGKNPTKPHMRKRAAVTNGKLQSLCWSDRGITAGLFCHTLSLSAMPPSIFTGKIFTELQRALIVGWEVAAGKHLPFVYIALV